MSAVMLTRTRDIRIKIFTGLLTSFLGRPYVVTGGLLFCPWCFFQRLISELPRPIALKLCHMVGMWLSFIIPLQNSWALPPKNWGPKTCKIRSIFATSDFDREYLRNGSTYPKSEKISFNHNHFHVGRKKNLVNFGPQTREIQWCILAHLNGFFFGRL